VRKFLVLILLAGFLVAGCDLFSSLSFGDIEGTWVFSDRTLKGQSASNIRLSILNDEQFDLNWDTVNGHYSYAIDGTLDKNVFSGSYSGWNSILGQIDNAQAIEITLSLKNERLIAKFNGAGTLDGLELSEGVKQ
jgi:hypothetical protein